MNQSIAEMLAGSAEEVLETMFFTQVVGRRPIPESTVDGAEQPHLAVRLCFLGGEKPAGEVAPTQEPGGHLDVEVSRDGAQWIASSFLASEDGSVSQHCVADVICELTNVVCGNIMSHLASQSGFSLLSPEVIRGSSAEWLHAVRYQESFELERGWITLRLGLVSAP